LFDFYLLQILNMLNHDQVDFYVNGENIDLAWNKKKSRPYIGLLSLSTWIYNMLNLFLGFIQPASEQEIIM